MQISYFETWVDVRKSKAIDWRKELVWAYSLWSIEMLAELPIPLDIRVLVVFQDVQAFRHQAEHFPMEFLALQLLSMLGGALY
jgi:hypothetical protein